MLSFWEKQSLLNYDIIVVGSGIVGLSTALSLREKLPVATIAVLERGVLPTGASTKNAGFACIGSLTEILDDLENMQPDEVLTLVELRLQGLRKLRARLGDTRIDYAENGSWELIKNTADQLAAIEKVDFLNELLRPVLKSKAFEAIHYKTRQQEFGFNPAHIEYIVKNNFEGELNSGKMMRCLIDLCLAKGIEIKTGCEVLRIEQHNDSAGVVVKHRQLYEEVRFKARRVAICTNAFTNSFYPEMDVVPGRGVVLVTRPIENMPFKGIYHFDKGYYYFRRLDDRLLFGGGRNLDFEGERSTDFALNPLIQQDLLEKINQLILPGSKVEVEDWWTGIMAFGASKRPILIKQSTAIYVGVRMGGMGVAVGSEIGERLATMIAGEY